MSTKHRPTVVGTIPPKQERQQVVELREDGRLMRFYSVTGAAERIGCSIATASRMVTYGDVRIIASRDGLVKMLLAEDVEQIARDRARSK
jgi:hypothetical protein